MRSIAARLVLLLAAMACADDAPRTRTFENEGNVCLSPRNGGGVNVGVLIDGCGSACDDVEAACTASLVNGAILVESEAVATSNGAEVCTTDCVPVQTACVLPELPDGTYQMHHGTVSATVTLPLPSAGPFPCTGDD
jgi:hypothetical protein